MSYSLYLSDIALKYSCVWSTAWWAGHQLLVIFFLISIWMHISQQNNTISRTLHSQSAEWMINEKLKIPRMKCTNWSLEISGIIWCPVCPVGYFWFMKFRTLCKVVWLITWAVCGDWNLSDDSSWMTSGSVYYIHMCSTRHD